MNTTLKCNTPLPNVRVYMPPNGNMQIITVTHINDEDAQFFIDGKYKVSIEQLRTGEMAAYALPPNGDDEDELCVVDFGDGPHATFQKLVEMCKAAEAGKTA